MLYDINKEQLGLINETLDVTIKYIGLKGAQNLLALAQHFNVGGEEGGRVELTNEQVAQVSEVLDISLRQSGLQGLNAIVQLVALFNNPIQEEVAAPIDEDAQVTE